MKRAHAHLAFALATLALSAVTASELTRLRHAQKINTSVAEWGATVGSSPPARASLPAPAPVSPPVPSPPEARLAHAVALARTNYDAALAAYKAIIQSNREDLRQLALYDLGNLHLRQAIRAGLADEAQSLPLTELAKQSYRDLLRRSPYDWDARYNLERALRLAPEEDEDAGDDTTPPDQREHERSTIADPRMDLP